MSRRATEMMGAERRAFDAFRAGVGDAEGLTPSSLLPDVSSTKTSFEHEFYNWGYRLKMIEKQLWVALHDRRQNQRREAVLNIPERVRRLRLWIRGMFVPRWK